MEPIVLFGIQFTLSLAAYSLIAFWYVAPRLSRLPLELALAPLLWVHAFRIVGGTILAPGAVGPGVPMEFRTMIGYGDMITALLAPAGVVRPSHPPPTCHRICLGVRHCWDARHSECDHSIRAFQRVHPCAWRELGDCDRLRASVACEQRLDLHATARLYPIHDQGVAIGGAPGTAGPSERIDRRQREIDDRARSEGRNAAVQWACRVASLAAGVWKMLSANEPRSCTAQAQR
jgi:hypothetical protein